jgi:phenylacetate-CoA ligase
VGSPEIALWGSPIETGKQDTVRNLRDRLLNSLLLSAFDLGEAALARHAQALLRFRPRKLFGYASALYLLAGYIERKLAAPRPSGLRVVFTTAEPLYDFQRATIQSVFGCPAAVEYGCRDAGLIANECPAGGLHVPSEGITVETLPEDGSDADGRGEIVVTNAYSFAMPMIRYRTGDIGSLATGACGCGRNLPRLGAVEGRRTDFLVTPEGRVMHALAAIYVLRELPGLRQFQVVQECADLVRVSLVTEPGFTRDTSEQAAAGLKRLLGHGVTVDVQVVSEIPPAASGKHRYVISKVADQQMESLQGRR